MEVVINTPGTKVRIDNGMLFVTNHEEEQKLPLHMVSSILIYRGCLLSSDLVFCAVENNIDILFGTRTGKPAARIWGNRFGSIATIRKKQILFSQNKRCASFIRDIIRKKLQNQISVMMLLYKPNRITDKLINDSIAYLEKYIGKLEQDESESMQEAADIFRGWEGSCSRKYFECINRHLPEQYRFERRSQHPALDMFNSLLNYAYGMLYGKIESALIRAGIDPFLGLFHRDEYNRPVFVYDVIEVFRYWADITVINLCMQQIIFPEFFDTDTGGWLLNLDGKRILIQSFNDYLEEVINLNNLERSRNTHIELNAQELASMFKDF
ncbi:MAG: CRISPR-associated endonuclease Cas1 [Bacteroidales bacterium]|nr:CRISPR-associated endonuclease Cas1 [Bacteroidales bacterium]